MAKILSSSIEEIFGSLEDPRRETENKRHKLLDILVISICACVCGANDFVGIAHFGRAKVELTYDFAETLETSQGRKEERRCWVSYDVAKIENSEQWKELTSVVMIESERTLHGKTSLEHRYTLRGHN